MCYSLTLKTPYNQRRDMNITIEPLRPEEIRVLSTVLGKAYVTSPLPIAVFGPNLRRSEGFIRIALERLPGQA